MKRILLIFIFLIKVNIGPEDIHDGNKRIILGLIWSLILRYQINMGMEDRDGDPNTRYERSEASSLSLFLSALILPFPLFVFEHIILHYFPLRSCAFAQPNSLRCRRRRRRRSAKDELLEWVNSKIVPLGHEPVKNFKKDWNDGVALSALQEVIAEKKCHFLQ